MVVMAFDFKKEFKRFYKPSENPEIIEIPKMNFMNLIESYPHYGIFLSRLLANRLVRQSKVTAKLKDEKLSDKQ